MKKILINCSLLSNSNDFESVRYILKNVDFYQCTYINGVQSISPFPLICHFDNEGTDDAFYEFEYSILLKRLELG